jgi:hypothetical protein
LCNICSLGEVGGFPWEKIHTAGIYYGNRFAPRSKAKLRKHIKAQIEQLQHKGALVASTVPSQKESAAILKQLGFKAVGEWMGNHDEKVTLWFKTLRPMP